MISMNDSGSLREALVDRLAAQWVSLGVSLAGQADQTLIDLEAAVVTTALVGRDDPRVYEGALDWCVRYGWAINAGRLKAIAREIAADAAALREFAALVAGGGGPHWPVADGTRIPYHPRGKVHVRDLRAPAVIAWRLRSAFGVAARADILTVLATNSGRSLSHAELARTTRSSKRNVALAVRALALADVVEVDQVGNEQRVRLTRLSGFRDWLGKTPPVFTDWAAQFAVVASVLRFDLLDRQSPIVQAVEARALVERLLPSIRGTELPMPDTSRLGAEFAGAFAEWRAALAREIAP